MKVVRLAFRQLTNQHIQIAGTTAIYSLLHSFKGTLNTDKVTSVKI